MTSRRCCCGVCGCVSCNEGKAACCYSVSDGADESLITWDEECTWTSKESLIAASMTISTTLVSIIFDGVTHTRNLSEIPDCQNWDGVTVGSLTISKVANNTCYGCACYCSECADLEMGTNTACCYVVHQGETFYYLSRDSEADSYLGCVWSADICGTEDAVILTLGGGVATVTIGESTYISYPELDPFYCCGDFIAYLDGDPTKASVAVYAAGSGTCVSNKYECVQLTISDVDNTCECSACKWINGTYSLTWDGDASYFGTLCKTSDLYDKCSIHLDGRGWNRVRVNVSQYGNGLAVRAEIFSRTTIAGEIVDVGSVVWKGVAYPGEYIGTYNLEFYSADSTYAGDCDFSASTATVTMGPECMPCGDSESCLPLSPVCPWCKDDAYPDYYEIVIPDGYVAGISSWGPGVEETYLVPAFCHYGQLNTGNTTCSQGPRFIDIDFVRDVRLSYYAYDGAPTYATRLYFAPFNLTPSNYCPGDSMSSYDCYLYDQVIAVDYWKMDPVSPPNCGAGGTWDGSQITIEAI